MGVISVGARRDRLDREAVLTLSDGELVELVRAGENAAFERIYDKYAGGILAFNVSNRYLDLEPVLAALAQDAGGSLACVTQEDLAVGAHARRDGKSPSQWAMILPAGDPLIVKLRPRGWRGWLANLTRLGL